MTRSSGELQRIEEFMRSRDLPTMKFRLDPDRIDRLHHLAQRRGESVADLLRDLVNQALHKDDAREARNETPRE